MNFAGCVLLCLCALGAANPRLAAQTSLYWDLKNGSGAGTNPTGTWDTTTTNWNTVVAGTGQAGLWTNGNIAVFSAGTDATGSYTVTLSGTISASSVSVEEGSPTFTGSSLTLTGAGGTFDVASGATATFNSTLAGTAGLTKTGAGTLTLGSSAIGYSGTTTVSGGTLQAGGSLSFSGGLTLGTGTTLALNGNTVSVGTLNVTGSSVIDFGTSTASTLQIGTLNLIGGATLTITGWVDIVDFFGVTTFTGATADQRGNGTASQVIFSGFSGSSTVWTKAGQVTPVPEPRTAGSVFMLGALAAWFFRASRRRA